MDNVVQLPLPLVWWSDIETWRNWRTVDNIKRPTEDAALDNIYHAARLVRGLRLGTSLSELEQQIYRLECEVKVMDAYANATPPARAEWIYQQLEAVVVIRRRHADDRYKASPFAGQVSGHRQVLAILDDISYAMRGYAQYEAFQEYNWEVGVVQEVLHELEANNAIKSA